MKEQGRETMSTLRIGSRFLAAAAILLVMAGVAATFAAAAGNRVLDPRLSLVGTCKEEELDRIEDPGCPHTLPLGEHPAAPFIRPRSVATDSYGNIYVGVWGTGEEGLESRIDIFDSDGRYITEIPKGVVEGPASLAVDSTGVLYVFGRADGVAFSPKRILVFEPCAPYDPATGEIDFCEPPTELVGPSYPQGAGPGGVNLAVNPANDHLFAHANGKVREYGSAAEGNNEIRSWDTGGLGGGFGVGLAVDAEDHKLYVQEGRPEGPVITIYELADGLPAGEGYTKIGSIAESEVPEEDFGGTLGLAVDEGTGHLFAYDGENFHVFEFDEDGNYLATVEFPIVSESHMSIAVDNGAFSPNGRLGEEEDEKSRILYVPSYPKANPGHLLAFSVANAGAPSVESLRASSVSEEAAELQAEINPGNLATNYILQFRLAGAAEWTTAKEGTLAAGDQAVEAFAGLAGLTPGSRYEIRVVATNDDGTDEAEASFATYPSVAAEPTPCPNVLLRTGPAALLPDCRAYELVTPASTNALLPGGPMGDGGGF